MTAPVITPTDTDRPQTASESAYEMFMGVLTIISLGVMAWMVIVRNEEVLAILVAVDTLFCFVFLADFARSMVRARDKRAYLFPQGILDLLGSIPAVGDTTVGIFRLFRFARLARVSRLLRGKGAAALARDFFADRQETALYLITILVVLVLLFGSIFVVYAENGAVDANIETASDAIWWAFVTITTVGYGDRYPVTEVGRFVAMLTMAVGIGIFGVVSSFLATYFLSGKAKDEEAKAAPPAPTAVGIANEVAALRAEIAALQGLVTTLGASAAVASPPASPATTSERTEDAPA
jgi:hypothetical protein